MKTYIESLFTLAWARDVYAENPTETNREFMEIMEKESRYALEDLMEGKE